MALRLDALVVSGEIFNTSHYAVHGWLELKGTERPLSLHLTGNPDDDLAGKHFRFEARALPAEARGLGTENDPAAALDSLAWQQVGPTGTMTAARQVRIADVPIEELIRRSELGEPPPSEWKPCLYLEWFSQNGRVVVELVDPVIEFIDDDAECAADDNSRFDALDDDDDDLEDLFLGGEACDDDEDDPYGLFPEDLQQSFDAQAWQVDREIGDDDSDDSLRELELMDELIETSDGEPINSLFDTPLKLPRPDEVDDAGAETALKTLLARLALYGIALDICPHFSPRDAYRLLLDEICVESRAYPELRQTQWVQHFMTSEYCAVCDGEMQIEYDEEDSDDNPPDDDRPPRDRDFPF